MKKILKFLEVILDFHSNNPTSYFNEITTVYPIQSNAGISEMLRQMTSIMLVAVKHEVDDCSGDKRSTTKGFVWKILL
jgi:hypothetical protein